MPEPAKRPSRDGRRAAWALLGLTVIVVALIVFTPGPPAPDRQRWLAQWLDTVHRTWMPAWITFDLVEGVSNAVMFLPLGLLGALTLRRRRWLVVPVLAACSTVIELIQAFALPQRDGTWHDVVANTAGALIGYGLAELVRRRRATRHRTADR